MAAQAANSRLCVKYLQWRRRRKEEEEEEEEEESDTCVSMQYHTARTAHAAHSTKHSTQHTVYCSILPPFSLLLDIPTVHEPPARTPGMQRWGVTEMKIRINRF